MWSILKLTNQIVWADIEGTIPVFWPHLEEFDASRKPLRWLLLVPVALLWLQLFPTYKQNKRELPLLCFSLFSAKGLYICTESLGTLDSLVVEDTCLLSALSIPSVSSPVDCPGEALVFFRSLLDLHWISVRRPASSGGNLIICVKYLAAHSGDTDY